MSNQLSRRRFMATTAAATAALGLAPELFALTPATCTITPEQETGPFYVADELLRSAISEGKPGVALKLDITILDARTCLPLPNAAIDLWHCDASGTYSGYTKVSLGPGGPGGPSGPEGPGDTPHGPPPLRDGDHQGLPRSGFGPGGAGGQGGPPAMKPTDKLTFCRGIQLTSTKGEVAYNTIFPGFYQGRVNHIHLKVRLGGKDNGHTYAAGHTAHTGQIFFPETLAVELMQQEPYNSHRIHRTTIAEDGVFNSQHGSAAVSTMTSAVKGYRAMITLYVDPTATPKDAGRGGPGGPPPQG